MDITGKSLIDGAWQTTDESMQFKAFYTEQNEFGEDVNQPSDVLHIFFYRLVL